MPKLEIPAEGNDASAERQIIDRAILALDSRRYDEAQAAALIAIYSVLDDLRSTREVPS